MQPKTRYAVHLETAKLELLRELYARDYGDVPAVIRTAIDIILNSAAEDAKCPVDLSTRIKDVIANGDVNKPPRVCWPSVPEPESVKREPSYKCRDCNHVFTWSGKAHDFQTCRCPADPVSVDFNDAHCIRLIGRIEKLESLRGKESDNAGK